MRPALFLIFVLTFSGASFAASTKGEICSHSEPFKEFLKSYSINDVWERAQFLAQFSQFSPLENKDIIFEEILHARKDYLTQVADGQSLLKDINSLSIAKSNEVSQLIEAYLKEVEEKILALEIQLTERLDSEKYKERPKLVSAIKKEIRGKYKPLLEEVLADATVSEDFVNNLLTLLPNGPSYSPPTPMSGNLHRYLWDLNYAAGTFRATERLVYGQMWMETIFNSELPGLKLNLAIRNVKNVSPSHLNIQIHFSPFPAIDQRVSLDMCDMSGEKPSCDWMSFLQWCKSQNESQ